MTERLPERPTHATADTDRDGIVGDADESRPIPAGGGGGTGLTVAEVGAEGGGAPGAQAALLKRRRGVDLASSEEHGEESPAANGR